MIVPFVPLKCPYAIATDDLWPTAFRASSGSWFQSLFVHVAPPTVTVIIAPGGGPFR